MNSSITVWCHVIYEPCKVLVGIHLAVNSKVDKIMGEKRAVFMTLATAIAKRNLVALDFYSSVPLRCSRYDFSIASRKVILMS